MIEVCVQSDVIEVCVQSDDVEVCVSSETFRQFAREQMEQISCLSKERLSRKCCSEY